MQSSSGIAMEDKEELIPRHWKRRQKRRLSLTQFYCLITLLTGAAIGFTAFIACTLLQLDFSNLLQWLQNLDEPTTISPSTSSSLAFEPQCSAILNDSAKFDCWPEFYNANEEQCTARGCCWQATKATGVPYCYYPQNYPGYNVTKMAKTDAGITASLAAGQPLKPFYTIKQLQVSVDFESQTRVRVRIFDPLKTRYTVPIKLNNNQSRQGNITDYEVTMQSKPYFSITIKRKSTNATLFDTQGMAPLIFSDQYIQVGTRLSTTNVFGLGEHRDSFLLNTSWNKLVLWNRDQPPEVKINLYGSHPFYVNMEADNKAHGVFLLNSNAMEVDLQPGMGGEAALTYRTTGGILDFFVLTGPSPDQVVQQYVQLVGLPFLPPFWALGFHLCKYGYHSAQDVQTVVKRNRDAQMPYDTQWTDIDYMDGYRDWTFNKNFSGLPAVIQDLHSNGQHYIIIVDPGISNTQKAGSYLPYDLGAKMNVFMKDSRGRPLVGKVWPGETVFPDFFHPNATLYWKQLIADFHQKIEFDGLWIDMNEPSNFVDGSVEGCTTGPLDRPPFVPPNVDGGSLVAKVPCPSAQQYVSSHYNLHNMYGWSEARSTMTALEQVLGQRSVVISRSTFPSSGVYGGHWTGDNRSLWSDLAFSIPAILQFQLFGVPFVGADICGFNGATTPELCTRWMQLGAFYPFMRNHNADKVDQDPAAFDAATQTVMRSILRIRYSLLPLLYTLLYQAHTSGSPVLRPLFFQYPGVYSETQFLWGDCLMISPVLQPNATTVTAFIPNDVWYDYYSGKQVTTVNKTVTLPAPLDHINVHVRGGSVLPMLPAATTTQQLRDQRFQLLVAPDNKNQASGQLYWDDGEGLDPVGQNKYTLTEFNLNGGNLTTTPVSVGYKPARGIMADTLNVFGVNAEPKSVTVNGKGAPFSYDSGSKSLNVVNLSLDLTAKNTVLWG